jgi:hypothetical protein
MGSLTWEIRNCKPFREMEAKIHEQNKLSIQKKKALRDNVEKSTPVDKEILEWRWDGPTMDTFKQYVDHAIHFGRWCRKQFGCRHYRDCFDHIQDYVNFLGNGPNPKSPSTIHTYLCGVCMAYGEKMEKYQKPLRISADFTRSRGEKKSDARKDRKPECSPRFYALGIRLGIRADELSRLRGNDFVKRGDYLYVLVKKGKGGKYQPQRVPPGQEDFVMSYFDGSNDYIFTLEETKNKIDVQHLRHYMAWCAYLGYKRLLDTPEYKEKLMAEIKAAYARAGKEREWNAQVRGRSDAAAKHCAKSIEQPYRLKKGNRTLAINAGFPVEYNRLALRAVSVFHLSHWRDDVTISNYLLAVAKDKTSFVNADAPELENFFQNGR